MKFPSFVHPLERGTESLPSQFTYPFRYTPHPLCLRAARVVQQKLEEMGETEGKMYGVLVVKGSIEALEELEELEALEELEELEALEKLEKLEIPATKKSPDTLFFLAAYSGQLQRSYSHPWFVPPVVDYLDPTSHFQQEQEFIVGINKKIEALKESEERRAHQERLDYFMEERRSAVEEAKRVYKERLSPQPLPCREGSSCRREQSSSQDQALEDGCQDGGILSPSYIRLRQFQKANIQRAKRLYHEEIKELEEWLEAHNERIRKLSQERKQRSEALQQWLFEQFEFLDGRGERKKLLDIFPAGRVPSGAGECCAPKLLQAAYKLGLTPIAMAEFWWGQPSPTYYRQPGAFFPACHSKCRPILGHMLRGLNVEPDPALHYEQALQPVRVLWQDANLAIIAKPVGWCSIPGRSDQANLFDEALRLWPDIEGSVIVHRLDQDTSGVMVIAKNARVHRTLSLQFERREVMKRYVALLEGELLSKDSKGLITLPLSPDKENLPQQIVDHSSGKEAVTDYEILGVERRYVKDAKGEREVKVTRVAFYPKTGRTHQLRVHSASTEGLGIPILGDRLYGHVADRLYLHAEALSFVHPVTHEPMHFELPCPF